MNSTWKMALAGVLSVGLFTGLAQAQEKVAEEKAPVAQQPQADQVDQQAPQTEAIDESTQSASAFRVTQLMDLSVMNSQNEDLGSIEDLVIDPHNGKIRYAALSFGGFLGIGDKLFAVPWEALQVRTNNDGDMYLHLDATKEKLKNAPGFNQDNWPDFASQTWSTGVDKFYGVQRQQQKQIEEAPRAQPQTQPEQNDLQE